MSLLYSIERPFAACGHRGVNTSVVQRRSCKSKTMVTVTAAHRGSHFAVRDHGLVAPLMASSHKLITCLLQHRLAEAITEPSLSVLQTWRKAEVPNRKCSAMQLEPKCLRMVPTSFCYRNAL